MTDSALPTADGATEWQQLGPRLREARLRAGISARELARRVGVSPQHISQVERGIGSFSANVLYAVTSQLRLSMDGLFDTEPAAAPAAENRTKAFEGGVVLRAANRPRIHLRGGPIWERLTPTPEGGIEFLETIYGPSSGEDADSGLTRHEGREYGVILSGALHVQVGFESTVLGPGDSIVFDSMTPHRFRNAAHGETRAIWFVLEGQSHLDARSTVAPDALLRRYEQHTD